MTKKGVSPLIATVLIIGFTIALAALIMTWGTTFIKQTQKEVEVGAEAQLQCAAVDLSIKSYDCGDNVAVPVVAGSVELESKYSKDMVVWIRVGGLKQILEPTLAPYTVETFNLDSPLTATEEIEVIPLLTTADGGENVCIQSSQKVNVECTPVI